MSGLSYICDEYGSDSEDSDTDKGQEFDRPKLPAPNLSKVAVVATHTHTDNPELHGGRSRLFPHVRGNWATFVYVNYDQVDAVCDLIDKFEEVVVTKIESCHRCDDFHISLSRTFVLKYHLISAFSSSLHKSLTSIEGFHLGFAAVKVYCNEDCSRTFISLEVDPFAQKHLLGVSNKVDHVLTEFQLPTFYENPSYHMSILWVNGDKKLELDSILDALNDLLFQEVMLNMAVPNKTKTLNMNCPDSCRNKVYINPNFNRPQRNILPNSSLMHVNPNFSYLVSNIQSSIQSKNKIYVNPNFIKSQCAGDQCMSIAVNQDVVPGTCLVNKSHATSLQHAVDKGATVLQEPIAHSRYSLVRRLITKSSLKGPVPEKSKNTFQINKYKTVPWKDVKSNLSSANITNKATTYTPFFEANSQTTPHEKKISSSGFNRRKTKFKLVNYDYPEKHEKSKIDLDNTKKVNQTRVKKTKGNLKKNNIPCPLFRKFGKCLRSLRGTCEFLHDKKHVSICRKFIKGLCHDSKCLLSHDLTTKKMPTCFFYLQGTCTKAECPYLHVKLNEKTKICPDFVKGYCEQGSKCLQRHINVSTNLKTKLSSQIKAPFLNKRYSKICQGNMDKLDRQKTKVLPKIEQRNLNSDESSEAKDDHCSDNNRYYKEQKEDECNNDSCEIKPMRCKLGTLPSFIQL